LSDAHDLATGYILSGYTVCVLDMLAQLGVARATALAWSLGGHIALDMIAGFGGLCPG
jgi:pimeloyl-ACP methyl ester carboxylesterase